MYSKFSVRAHIAPTRLPTGKHLSTHFVQFSSVRGGKCEAASRGKARGILMWKLCRKIGAAIVRANAMLLMDLVAYTGVDAAAAYLQQSRAESRFFWGGPSRGFLCPQTAAERGSSMGGAVIGGWALQALSRRLCLLSSPTFPGASTHFGSTFQLCMMLVVFGLDFIGYYLLSYDHYRAGIV